MRVSTNSPIEFCHKNFSTIPNSRKSLYWKQGKIFCNFLTWKLLFLFWNCSHRLGVNTTPMEVVTLKPMSSRWGFACLLFVYLFSLLCAPLFAFSCPVLFYYRMIYYSALNSAVLAQSSVLYHLPHSSFCFNLFFLSFFRILKMFRFLFPFVLLACRNTLLFLYCSSRPLLISGTEFFERLASRCKTWSDRWR